MHNALTCLIVADDLTGACDAAAPFAARGYSTEVSLGPNSSPPAGCEVLAISTETRSLDAARVADVYANLSVAEVPARIIFKKIDSTLRGNIGAEIAAAARAFACDAALVTPAFPAMGRVVSEGFLQAPGAAPIGMEEYWRGQQLAGCVHTRGGGVQAALASGARYVSGDACCDADLDALVACGMAYPSRLLWAGSAGLGHALARVLRPDCVNAELEPEPRFPAVLFCIGSDHPVTLSQLDRLASERPVFPAHSESVNAATLGRAIASGIHVALRIERGTAAFRIGRLLDGIGAPIVLSGGDTASLVCRALQAGSITLRGELAAGIPIGTFREGGANGIPVVTKAGGFGSPDALIRIADHFTCPKL